MIPIREVTNETNRESEDVIDEGLLEMVLNAAASVIQRGFRKHLDKLEDQQRENLEDQAEWRIRPYRSPMKKVEGQAKNKASIESQSPWLDTEIDRSNSPKMEAIRRFEKLQNQSIADILN